MPRAQANPAPRLAAWLATVMPGADVDTRIPKGWTPGTRPLIVIADDGGPVDWPAKSDHTIRVVARHAGPANAHQAARTAIAHLHDAHLPGIVVDRSSGGIIEARDTATAVYLASALMTVHARTEDL